MSPGLSVKRTTDAGPFSTPESAGILAALSVTGDGVKKFKITASFQSMTGTVVGDVFAFYLKDGATVIKTHRVYVTSALQGFIGAAGGTITAVDTPAVGSHSYTLTAIRLNGTGTGVVVGNAAAPIDIIVEQIA